MTTARVNQQKKVAQVTKATARRMFERVLYKITPERAGLYLSAGKDQTQTMNGLLRVVARDFKRDVDGYVDSYNAQRRPSAKTRKKGKK